MMEKLKKIQERLYKKGIKVSKEQLIDAIFKFAIENENELLKVLKRENYEDVLKKWLETPVEIEATDSLKEHDLVSLALS